MKEIPIQYVTDQNGNKTAVLIPIKDWENIERDLQEFLEYMNLKKSLKNALSEVKNIKQKKASKISLNDFLNEC